MVVHHTKVPDAARMRRPGHDHYFDVLTERVEETKEPVRREAAKPTAYQIGDAWLVHAEDLGCFRLCQSSLLDDHRDPGSDLGLDEHLIALSKPDVLEDIPAAPLDRDLGLGPSPIRPTCS